MRQKRRNVFDRPNTVQHNCTAPPLLVSRITYQNSGPGIPWWLKRIVVNLAYWHSMGDIARSEYHVSSRHTRQSHERECNRRWLQSGTSFQAEHWGWRALMLPSTAVIPHRRPNERSRSKHRSRWTSSAHYVGILSGGSNMPYSLANLCLSCPRVHDKVPLNHHRWWEREHSFPAPNLGRTAVLVPWIWPSLP